MRARFLATELPAALSAELSAAHATLCERAGAADVAVRSSATTEDAADASFAGLQDTYLWVRDAATMLERVRACWASLYSVESISYRRDPQYCRERSRHGGGGSIHGRRALPPA